MWSHKWNKEVQLVLKLVLPIIKDMPFANKDFYPDIQTYFLHELCPPQVALLHSYSLGRQVWFSDRCNAIRKDSAMPVG